MAAKTQKLTTPEAGARETRKRIVRKIKRIIRDHSGLWINEPQTVPTARLLELCRWIDDMDKRQQGKPGGIGPDKPKASKKK